MLVRPIVLAAGCSKRMGAQNKLLLEWKGRPLIAHVVESIVDAGLDPLVVTGHQRDEVISALPKVQSIHNSDFESGMGGSIACGVHACGPCDGFAIVLGDMPSLSTSNLLHLIDRFEKAGSESIVVPHYSGSQNRRGHPVLFPALCRALLEALRGPDGARSVVKSGAFPVVSAFLEGEFDDIDAPGDYQKLLDQ